MDLVFDDVVKLFAAVVIGGLIGAEREFRDKSAGFRTNILICVGATVFTILSVKLGKQVNDPARIAAAIVSGIGFLGAGAILRSEGRILGLTTAATIWLTAALGMTVGVGEYAIAAVSTVLALVVLGLFPIIERWIDRARETRVYEISCPLPPLETADPHGRFRELEGIFTDAGLKVHSHKEMKSDAEMICVWEVIGALRAHDEVMERMFSDPGIIRVQF